MKATLSGCKTQLVKATLSQAQGLIFVVLVLTGALSRLVPHGWNFTAMGAVTIVSGLLIKNRTLSITAPLLALLISDVVIGFHSTMIYVYGAYALIVGLGLLFSQDRKFKNIILTSVAASLLFFIISNFGVWAQGVMYPLNISGLMQCFMMGVPFYKNQFLSDLIFTPLLFFSLVKLLNSFTLSTIKSGPVLNTSKIIKPT